MVRASQTLLIVSTGSNNAFGSAPEQISTPSIEARIARAANLAANRAPSNLDGTIISVPSNLTITPYSEVPIVD
jgi:hypothetical protein